MWVAMCQLDIDKGKLAAINSRKKIQLKYFPIRDMFCDFLFKRVAPEEG